MMSLRMVSYRLTSSCIFFASQGILVHSTLFHNIAYLACVFTVVSFPWGLFRMRIYRGILSHGAFLQAANPTLLVGKNNGRKHWNNGSGQYFFPTNNGTILHPTCHAQLPSSLEQVSVSHHHLHANLKTYVSLVRNLETFV